MHVIKDADNYTPTEKPLILALGNFDGVHCGHKRLISKAVERANAENGIAAAFIFNPHPATILTPDRAPRILVSAERKAELLEQQGLDLLIYQTFSLDIASLGPEEFVTKILVDRLKVSEVVVGFNYSFGYRGAGSPELLKALGAVYGFQTHVVPPVMIDDEVVSSSLIRAYLQSGNQERANRLLGYCFD